MNRLDFQKLAEIRIHEAHVLLDAGCYHGAYYLAGYAVECALKACICKSTKEYDFPPDRKYVENVYCHNIETLASVANIKTLKDEKMVSSTFTGYYGIVRDWNESKRYDTDITADQAHDLYEAVTDEMNGILTWLKSIW